MYISEAKDTHLIFSFYYVRALLVSTACDVNTPEVVERSTSKRNTQLHLVFDPAIFFSRCTTSRMFWSRSVRHTISVSLAYQDLCLLVSSLYDLCFYVSRVQDPFFIGYKICVSLTIRSASPGYKICVCLPQLLKSTRSVFPCLEKTRSMSPWLQDLCRRDYTIFISLATSSVSACLSIRDLCFLAQG